MTEDRYATDLETWTKAVGLSLMQVQRANERRWLSTDVEDLYPTPRPQQHPDGPRWMRRAKRRNR